MDPNPKPTEQEAPEVDEPIVTDEEAGDEEEETVEMPPAHLRDRAILEPPNGETFKV